MVLRAICLPAIRFPSCFILSHSLSLLGVPFISVVPLSSIFCLRIKKIEFEVLVIAVKAFIWSGALLY